METDACPEKIAVIGCNSFSGAHFVRRALEEGCQVLGISRSPEPHQVFLPRLWEPIPGGGSFTFRQMDLNNDLGGMVAEIATFQPACIVNFASQSMVAESWEHPEQWYQTNVVANVALHDRLRKFDFLRKYVHITTPEVYGSVEGVVDESYPFNPTTPYAVSRAACDMHLLSFHRQYGFPVVFTRAANVYGPGQQLYRIIPRTILFIKLGRKLQLHGGGRSVRSFIHIKDVVDGTIAALRQAPPPSTFHFSTDRFISIRELVEMICDKLGTPFEQVVEIVGDRPGKDLAYKLDSSKARRELAWAPRIQLEQGIDETIQWVEKSFDHLRSQPLNYLHKP